MIAGTAAAAGHPCFDAGVRERVGRVHLPVAPRCNLDCNYCERSWCVHEVRPGVATAPLRPHDVAAALRRHQAADPRIRVVGIAGPGEPLFNDETFEALEIVARAAPALLLCVSTNGLLLPEKLDALQAVGVRHLTVTVNAVDVETAALMNPSAAYQGRRYLGREAAELLVRNQLAGVRWASRRGMRVKVNCVYAPAVNGHRIPDVARAVGAAGATLFNVIPLVPRGRFSGERSPSRREVEAVRSACGAVIPQMRHCRRCRADASGVLTGRDGGASNAPSPPVNGCPGREGVDQDAGRGGGSALSVIGRKP